MKAGERSKEMERRMGGRKEQGESRQWAEHPSQNIRLISAKLTLNAKVKKFQ
jgi:hypothetical protein